MEPCFYENDIKELSKTIPRLEEKINNLVLTTSSHTTVIANLINFQSLTQGEQKGRKDEEEKLRIANELKETKKRDNWYRSLTISGFIIIIALSVFNHYTSANNSKEIIATKDTLRYELRMQEGVSKVTRGGYVRYNDRGLSDSINIYK
jgi:hypothetical protein